MPFTGNPHYNVQGNYAPQQLHIPFPHPNVQGAYPPQQSHLPFSQPDAQNVYPPQQSDIPFPHAISQGICAQQHPHMPLSQPSTSSVAHPPDHTYREFNPVTLQNVTTPHKIYDDGTGGKFVVADQKIAGRTAEGSTLYLHLKTKQRVTKKLF